jgi:hypothetical protein
MGLCMRIRWIERTRDHVSSMTGREGIRRCGTLARDVFGSARRVPNSKLEAIQGSSHSVKSVWIPKLKKNLLVKEAGGRISINPDL